MNKKIGAGFPERMFVIESRIPSGLFGEGVIKHEPQVFSQIPEALLLPIEKTYFRLPSSASI